MTTETSPQPVNDISRIAERILEKQLLTDISPEQTAALVRVVFEAAGDVVGADPQYGVLINKGYVDTSYDGGFRSFASAQYAAAHGYVRGAAVKAMSRTTITVHTDWV